MKTAGWTFRHHILANFGIEHVYPSPTYEFQMHKAYNRIGWLLSLPRDRLTMTRVFTGHFPFVVTEMLGIEVTTLTLLREPVERTISYLKHCTRYNEQHKGLTLEEVYEDPFVFQFFIRDHQAKVFSMTTEDKLETYMDVIDVDEARLEIARHNLSKVDVLGFTDCFDEFLGELEQNHGWRIGDIEDVNVSKGEWEVPDRLIDRIIEDNARDIEFYEFARQLYADRRTHAAGA